MLELWGNRGALRWLTAADAILYLYILYWFWKAQRSDEAQWVSVGSPPRVRLFAAVSGALGLFSVGAYFALVLYLDAALSSVPLALSLSLLALLVLNAGLTPILTFTLRVQRSRQRAQYTSAQYPGAGAAPASLLRALSDHSGRKQVLQFVLAFVALILLIIAAMRPQTTGKQHKVKHNGVDIVFAVDLSKSMLAEDLKPSRLQAARNEVHALLDQLKGERVGLVVFTATAFSQCPLTSDYGVLHNYIDSIEPHLMPRGGTAIGRAIDEARYLLSGKNPRRERLLAGGSSAPKPAEEAGPQNNKLLILFSDGEDHETDPQRAALAARQDHIRIFTVGLGTPSGSSIPKFKDDMRIGVETHHGAPIHTRMDESLLRDVASSTGGLYIAYSGPNSVVQPVLDQIARMDSMQHESDLTRYRDDHFFWVLWPAALLLLLSGLLGDRKGFSWRGVGLFGGAGGGGADVKPSSGRVRRRRKPSASSAAALLLCVCAAAAALSQQGCASEDDKSMFERPNAHVEAANQRLSDRKVNAALESYRQAALELPKHPILDYNFGVATFYLSDVVDPSVESTEDALQRALVYLERALRAPLSETDTHFRIHYNIGNTYLKLARRLILNPPAQSPNDPIPALDPLLKAADSYAQALSFTPDSDDARYNLELALALTTPPCAQFEDEFEPNNDPASASANPPDLIALAKSKKPTHTLCGGNDDLFPLPPDAAPGDRIQVSATFSRLPQRKKQPPLDDSALLEFAQIEVAVIDAKGNTLAGVRLNSPAAPPADPAAPTANPANPANPATPPVDPLAPVLAQDLGPDQPPAKLIQKLTREIPPLTLAAALPSGEPPALPLFVRVRGIDNAEALYSIRIDHRPPCQKLDDPFEGNNVLTDAKPLTPDRAMPRGGPIPLPPTGDHYQLRACPADEDWFSLRTNPGDALFIDLNPAKDALTDLPPKLTLEVFADDDPTPIRSAGLDANGLTLQDGLLNIELFDLDPLMAESHLLHLRVSAADAQQEGNYTLTVYHYPPCPSGDDPLAPNHAATSRATLDPKQKFIRYLRVCPNTPDYFLAQAKGPEEPPAPAPAPTPTPAPAPAPTPAPAPPGAGPDTTNQIPDPPVVGFNAHIEYDPRFGDLSLTARDPDDQSILPKGEGAVGKSQTPKKQIKTISLAGALEGQAFQLDVQGDPSFYSLYLLNNDEQDKAENQGGSGDSGEPKDPSAPQEPQEGDPQPQDPQDPQDPQGQGDQDPPDEPPPGGQGHPGDPDEGERRQQELTEDFLEDLESRDRGLHRLDPDVDDSSPLNDW